MTLTACLLLALAASPDAGTGAPPKAARDPLLELIRGDTGAVTPPQKKPPQKKPLVQESPLSETWTKSPLWKDSNPNDPKAFEGLKMKGAAPPESDKTLPGSSKGRGGGTGKADAPPAKESAPKTQPPARKPRGDIDLDE